MPVFAVEVFGWWTRPGKQGINGGRASGSLEEEQTIEEVAGRVVTAMCDSKSHSLMSTLRLRYCLVES
jgi:hypothetical protein